MIWCGSGVHVRGVDGHHRVEQEREVDALGLEGELEVVAVAVEGPRAFGRGEADGRLVGAAEQPLFDRSLGSLVDDLHGAVADRHDGDDGGDQGGLDANQRDSRLESFLV